MPWKRKNAPGRIATSLVRRAGVLTSCPVQKGEHMMDLLFEVDDLELDDLTVTSMRDGVALPESGASNGSSSCSCGSSSCCCCQVEVPPAPMYP